MTMIAKTIVSVVWTVIIYIGADEVSAKTTKLFAQNVGLLMDGRIDPLVNPKSCSTHVHSVYGNAQFSNRIKKKMYKDKEWRKNIKEKYDQTTSELVENISSYWVPSMYIYNSASQQYYLVPSFSRPYYRIEHAKSDDTRVVVNPYPDFLRMIVGDASRKQEWNDDDDVNRDNIRWTLTTYNRRTTNYLDNGDWSYLKQMDTSIIADRGQVELLLKFPNCLAIKKKSGKPITKSKNFRDHAAYADQSTNDWNDIRGWCPASHPYPIPRLDLEIRYNLAAMRHVLDEDVVNDPNNWVLSTGDKSGAGGHADFVSGWPTELMENIIAHCTDGHGRDCVLDEKELDGRDGRSKTVPYTNPIPDEEVHMVSTLPKGDCPPMVKKEKPKK